jgi:hypothetical protein
MGGENQCRRDFGDKEEENDGQQHPRVLLQALDPLRLGNAAPIGRHFVPILLLLLATSTRRINRPLGTLIHGITAAVAAVVHAPNDGCHSAILINASRRVFPLILCLLLSAAHQIGMLLVGLTDGSYQFPGEEDEQDAGQRMNENCV